MISAVSIIFQTIQSDPKPHSFSKFLLGVVHQLPYLCQPIKLMPWSQTEAVSGIHKGLNIMIMLFFLRLFVCFYRPHVGLLDLAWKPKIPQAPHAPKGILQPQPLLNNILNSTGALSISKTPVGLCTQKCEYLIISYYIICMYVVCIIVIRKMFIVHRHGEIKFGCHFKCSEHLALPSNASCLTIAIHLATPHRGKPPVSLIGCCAPHLKRFFLAQVTTHTIQNEAVTYRLLKIRRRNKGPWCKSLVCKHIHVWTQKNTWLLLVEGLLLKKKV